MSRYGLGGRVCRAWHHATIDVVYENTWSDRKAADWGRAKMINYHWVQGDEWPPEARLIMEKAGLEPDYRHLLDRISRFIREPEEVMVIP